MSGWHIDTNAASASPNGYDYLLKKCLISTLPSKTPTAASEFLCVVTSLIRWLIFPTTLCGSPTKALELSVVITLPISWPVRLERNCENTTPEETWSASSKRDCSSTSLIARVR